MSAVEVVLVSGSTSIHLKYESGLKTSGLEMVQLDPCEF